MQIKDVHIISSSKIWEGDICIENNKIKLLQSHSCEAKHYIIPGLLDGHTHGFRGYTSECGIEDYPRLAKEYAKRGVLGFLATIGPRPFSHYLNIIHEARAAFNKPYEGARFLGFHLEGPYLNPQNPGAIDPESIYPIQLDEFEDFLKQVSDVVRVISIAPEIPLAQEAMALMKKYNVIASGAHTLANYEQSEAAIGWGMSHATHTFNAMAPLHHRNPGMITSVLLNDQVKCEMISDGYHIQEAVMKLLMKMKGKEKVICVSDSGSESGYSYEEGYQFEDGTVVRGGAMIQPNGVIAGSTKDMLMALKMFAQDFTMDWQTIVAITSLNLADSLSLKWGSLEEGMIMLNRDFELEQVWIDPALYLVK